jgi:tetratricopeptide (TPR) repeat protein
MENRIPRKGLKIYLLLIFIGIFFLTSIQNPCFAQGKVNENEYLTLIQQADKDLASKNYGNALFLYEKASRAKPELKYASGKMADINATLEADPNTRAEIFENTILNAENFYKQKNYPEAKTEYRKAMLIDPTLEFPRERLAKISAVYMDPEDQAYFDNAVTKGDNAVTASEFEKAISFYEAALTVKPDAKAVKDKITNTRKQWADYKVRTEQSKKSIAAADKMLQAGKRTEARAEYQKALALFPDNQYARQKTQEIDNYDQNAKAIQASYDKAIEQADQFYINRDFASARLKYQEALNSKPEARYPKEMLEKTKTG